MIRWSRQAAAITTVAIAVCLAGCSSGVIFNSGPLGGQGSTGINCAPTNGQDGVVSYGTIEFANASASPVFITKVSLVDPRGLRMLAVYVVPVTGDTLSGFVQGYPSSKKMPSGEQWSGRQRADGAIINHSRGQDVTNLIAVLKPTRNPGWARGINIYYHSSGGQRYLLRQGLQILVGINGCPFNLQRYERN
jgi:hypothetical protein